MEEYQKQIVDRLAEMDLDHLGEIVTHKDDYEPYVAEEAKRQMQSRFGVTFREANEGITYVNGKGTVVGYKAAAKEPGMKWYRFKMYIQMPLTMIGFVGCILAPWIDLIKHNITDVVLIALLLSPIYAFLLIVWWITLHKMRTFAKNAMPWIYSVIWITTGLALLNALLPAVTSSNLLDTVILKTFPAIFFVLIALAECGYFQKRKYLFAGEQS